MQKLSNLFEIFLCKVVIWFLQRGYGPKCDTSDIDDFPDMYKTPKDVFNPGRCAACRANEVVDWLKSHIDLIRGI